MWQDLYLNRRYFISPLIWYPITYILECIFLEPSEIDRKGPEKHMEEQAFELNLSKPPLFLGLRVQNSLTAIALAVIALAAFVFLLCYCAWKRYCDVVENHHRLEIQNRGNQGR